MFLVFLYLASVVWGVKDTGRVLLIQLKDVFCCVNTGTPTCSAIGNSTITLKGVTRFKANKYTGPCGLLFKNLYGRGLSYYIPYYVMGDIP